MKLIKAVRGTKDILGETGTKYAYINTYSVGDRLRIGWPFLGDQPYDIYAEDNIANPDLRWETATQQNFKLETRMFNGDVHFSVDYFMDNREVIFISGNGRNIPIVFGADPVAANIGSTETRGFELQLDLSHNFNDDSRAVSGVCFTVAFDLFFPVINCNWIYFSDDD